MKREWSPPVAQLSVNPSNPEPTVQIHLFTLQQSPVALLVPPQPPFRAGHWDPLAVKQDWGVKWQERNLVRERKRAMRTIPSPSTRPLPYLSQAVGTGECWVASHGPSASQRQRGRKVSRVGSIILILLPVLPVSQYVHQHFLETRQRFYQLHWAALCLEDSSLFFPKVSSVHSQNPTQAWGTERRADC